MEFTKNPSLGSLLSRLHERHHRSWSSPHIVVFLVVLGPVAWTKCLFPPHPKTSSRAFSRTVVVTTQKIHRSAMLIPTMNISRLMVHAKQIEEQKLKQVGREIKRGRVDDGNSSKGRFEVQGKPRFKKRFSNQGTSSTSKVNKERVPTPKPQGGSEGGSYVDRPTCANCGKRHDGKCLVRTDGLFSCDPGATLSFVTSLVSMKFDVIPVKLEEPFLVSTPIGDSIVARTGFRSQGLRDECQAKRGKPRPKAKAAPNLKLLPQTPRPSPRLVVKTTTSGRLRGVALAKGGEPPSVIDTAPTFTRGTTSYGPLHDS
uniref:Gag-pol polyprotein n=1 Tax=Solanum tuberosum TaxID=4113 RepID=M1DRH0_SOLTU